MYYTSLNSNTCNPTITITSTSSSSSSSISIIMAVYRADGVDEGAYTQGQHITGE